MNRRLVVVVVAGVVLLGAAAWTWQSQRGAQSRDALTLYGNVDIRQVSLAFGVSERIAELRASEGDRVHAGEVLGSLDTRTAKLRLAQGAAQIGVQQQALERLRNGARPEELAQARAAVAAADSQAALAAKQYERVQATSVATAGQGVSQQDVDSALAQRDVARAQADNARQALRLAEAGARREDRAQAEQQLVAAQAAQALLQRQVEESELRAPSDAVVRARLLEPGDMASPQRPVYTLALTEPKWVRAYVAEADLARVRVGMPASVSTDSDPGASVPAKLDYISSVAEFTPKTVQTPELRTSLVYEVRFRVDDPQDRLRLGMPATVHLALRP
jgi:HlyD family secretion protein